MRDEKARSLVRSALDPIYGYVYDVKSSRMIEVEEATKAGAAG